MESEDVLVDGEETGDELILHDRPGAEGSSERNEECIDIEDHLYEEWRDRQWSERGDEHAIADTDD